MAHPVTRLSGGTCSDYRQQRGGIPVHTQAEIAQAAGNIHDRLRYWTVLSYAAGIHPPADEWPVFFQEVQNLVIRCWREGGQPARMSPTKIAPMAETAWVDFLGDKRMTLQNQAESAEMTVGAWRGGYQSLHGEIVNRLQNELGKGLRSISAELRDVEN